MQEHDRTAFLDSMIEAVATNVWRDLSGPARAALPVIGSHSALYGRDVPVPISRICEHSGLSADEAADAVAELAGLKLVESLEVQGDEACVKLTVGPVAIREQHTIASSIREMIDDGAVKVYGNLTIHVEEPSVELMRLTTGLADLLAAQAEARDREAERVEHKVEIVKYREPVEEADLATGN